MAWDIRPIAVCTQCDAPLHMRNSRLLHERCGHIVDDKRCRGYYEGSTIKRSDWKACTGCVGKGSKAAARCGMCHGSGWYRMLAV
jgi:DnaJ-class molecular chaperone